MRIQNIEVIKSKRYLVCLYVYLFYREYLKKLLTKIIQYLFTDHFMTYHVFTTRFFRVILCTYQTLPCSKWLAQAGARIDLLHIRRTSCEVYTSLSLSLSIRGKEKYFKENISSVARVGFLRFSIFSPNGDGNERKNN